MAGELRHVGELEARLQTRSPTVKLFEYKDLAPVLRVLANSDVRVLVGGQALNYWCTQFPTLELQHLGPFTSKDLDYQSTYADATAVAIELGTVLQTPADPRRTFFIGVVEVTLQSEATCKVDFLEHPLGLTAEEVNALKFPVDLGNGSTLFVLHPLHCLMSRTHNVAELPKKYANQRGLGQLRAAVVVLREFIRGEDEDQVLKLCEKVRRFCFTEQALDVHRDHGLDVLEAVPVDALPQRIVESALPHWVRQVQKERERHVKRPRRAVS